MKPTQRLTNCLRHNPEIFRASPTTPNGNATASADGLGYRSRLNGKNGMNGVLVVDKPAAMTSAQVVAEVKTVLKAKKVGHTGTLDPFATGVLVCCVDRATRLARFIMHGKKCYEAVMHLGIRTDTQDLTGQVVYREPNLRVTHHKVRSAFQRFLEIKEQVPPAFSALKHRGVPLYKLARQGEFPQKPARRVSINNLEVLDIQLPYVHFEVSCSQGTYVRTLCADIGEALGCGAHLAKLCRTESGGFTLGEAVSLDALKKLAGAGELSGRIIPMSHALRGMPEVKASFELVRRIRHGQPVTKDELGRVEDSSSPWIKVTDAESNLIAVMCAKGKNGKYPYACVFPN